MNKKEIPNQEQIWNEIAEQWKEFRSEPVPEVVEFLKDKRGNILDLGCGSGRNFVKVDGVIYGVDFSKELLKYAEKSAKDKGIKVILKKEDVSRLSFKDNFFDSGIYNNTLHCIPEEEKRKKSLEELYRVLKPNAECFISVWDKDQPKFRKSKKEIILSWTAGGKRRLRYYYLYGKEELKKILEDTGFKINKMIGHNLDSGGNSKRSILAYVKK